MNRYSWPVNALVAALVASGILLALPNYFGTSPALEVSLAGDDPVSTESLEGWSQLLTDADLAPAEARLENDRGLLYYADVDSQLAARTELTAAVGTDYTITYKQASNSPGWLRNLGLEPMSLGLDLRGGVYFLLEVDLEAAESTRLEQYARSFEDELRDANIRRRVRVEGSVVRVRVQSADTLEEARRLVRGVDADLEINDGPDGTSLLVRMTPAQVEERENLAIEQNIVTLRNRINALGVSEPLVQRQGRARIVVQLPGVQDPAEADRILTSTATLEFHAVDEEGNTAGGKSYPTRDGRSVRIKREIIASGDQIIDAGSTFSQGQPAVTVRLDSVGGNRMLEFTQENVGRRMAVLYITSDREKGPVVEGEQTYRTVRDYVIISDATVRGVFKNNFEITGLTPVEARDLALLLRAGALAAPIFKVEERTIGPTLGQENIDRGFSAVQIGFFAVIAFMIVYYRVFGVFASLALLTNLVMIVALLSLLQASLTLPGIAGIVLTVGMAVDANVLIFERIREELRDGSSVQIAINAGYEKAFSSIADANITTLIAALMLFVFGTGPIRGFAITLMLGIVTSMFTAIVGTRALVNALYGGRNLKDLPV
ncbi:MAG: protein translocase subunit SecD [Pseudomonadota bacterium]